MSSDRGNDTGPAAQGGFVAPGNEEALSRLTMPMLDAMQTQRAVRRLHTDPVDLDLIYELLELSLKAPTSSNTQDWAYIVVTGREQKERLARLYRPLFRAFDPIVRRTAKSEQELWTSKDVAGLSYESMRGLMRRGNENDDGMMKALRDAGVDGFVVKRIMREKGNPVPVATMELTKVEKKSLKPALFEIPAGYTKKEGMMGAASVMAPPGAGGEEMRKAMEGLSPEQRKQIEEMMKRQQGAK